MLKRFSRGLLSTIAAVSVATVGTITANTIVENSVHRESKALQNRIELFHDDAVEVYKTSMQEAGYAYLVGAIVGAASVGVGGLFWALSRRDNESSASDSVAVALNDLQEQIKELKFQQLELEVPVAEKPADRVPAEVR